MPPTRRQSSATQLQPLPEIVDPRWICGRYAMSPRQLERHVADGVLKPFRPGQRRLRFYTREVIEAFEGLQALKGRTFLASQPETVRRRKYHPPPIEPVSHSSLNGYDGIPDLPDDIDVVEPD